MSRNGATYCPIGPLLTFAMSKGCCVWFGGRPVSLDELRESGPAPGNAVFAAHQPRVVVQRQNQPIHGKHELVRVGIGPEVSDFNRLLDCAHQLALPRSDHADQKVAYRPGPIVVLHGSRNEHAAAFDFDAAAVDPARIHGLQPGETAWLLQAWKENVFDETPLVLFQHGDLQILARAEVREHAALRHLEALGNEPDGQALQAGTPRQLERCGHDSSTGLFAFAHEESRGWIKSNARSIL